MRTILLMSVLILSAQSFAGFTVTSLNQTGKLFCYNTDKNGRAFGYPVDESNCHVGYRSEADEFTTQSFCFHVDSKGRSYGYPVDRSFCDGR